MGRKPRKKAGKQRKKSGFRNASVQRKLEWLDDGGLMPPIMVIRRKEDAVIDDNEIGPNSLWRRLAGHTLLELTPPDQSYMAGSLLLLYNFGIEYHAENDEDIASPDDLTLIMAMPGGSDDLQVELGHMKWQIRDLGDGYAEILGAKYPIYVVFSDVVGTTENHEFLGIFTHPELEIPEAHKWFRAFRNKYPAP